MFFCFIVFFPSLPFSHSRSTGTKLLYWAASNRKVLLRKVSFQTFCHRAGRRLTGTEGFVCERQWRFLLLRGSSEAVPAQVPPLDLGSSVLVNGHTKAGYALHATVDHSGQVLDVKVCGSGIGGDSGPAFFADACCCLFRAPLANAVRWPSRGSRRRRHRQGRAETGRCKRRRLRRRIRKRWERHSNFAQKGMVVRARLAKGPAWDCSGA